MATMLGNLFTALVEAGASQDKAQAAAEEAYAAVRTHDTPIASLQDSVANLRTEVRVLAWITGTMFLFILAIFYKVWVF